MKHASVSQQFHVKKEDSGARLDIFLSLQLKETRSHVQKLIKHGKVLVNGVAASKSGKLIEADDVVRVNETETNAGSIDMEALSRRDAGIRVIAETASYLVIEKPSGIATHPLRNTTEKKGLIQSDTVAGWVMRQYPKLWGVGEYLNRPGIVHRLDKEASGLMVIAKNQTMFLHLKKQFQERKIEKYYYALAYGVVGQDHATLRFPIARGKDGKMAARPHIEKVTLKNVDHLQEGREAVTEFWVDKRFHNYSLMNVRIHTGRTHQIRVHFFAYNHPLVGDSIYFHKKRQTKVGRAFPRLFLHAYRLCLTDTKGERQCFESPLPQELSQFLEVLS